MFKKIGLVALVVVGGLFLLNRTNLGSYASTAWKKVRQGACNQVPLEFEVERVRHEISQLVPDMKDSIKAIAEESVAVENLRDEIAASVGPGRAIFYQRAHLLDYLIGRPWTPRDG